MDFLKKAKQFKWKEIVFVALIAGVVVDIGVRLYRNYLGLPDGTTLSILGGVAVIPSKYFLDTMGGGAGTMFVDFSQEAGGRIAAGRRMDIKPEFWTWVRKSLRSEEARCGISVAKLEDSGVRSSLVYDDHTFLLFVSVPDAEIEKTLSNLCHWRSRHGRMTSSFKPSTPDGLETGR